MSSKIIKQEGNKLIIQTEIELDDSSMLHSEKNIQKVVNELGNLLTGESLSLFDTDGSPIVVDGVHYSSKGSEKKDTRHLTG